MKKFLSLVLVLVLSLSVFAACGKGNDTNEPDKTGEANNTQVEELIENNKADETPAPAANDSTSSGNKPAKKPTSNIPSAATPAPSENKDVVTENNAPDVYLVINSDDNAATISYHLKECNLLKGGESQKVAWEMIKTLGFRQCPKCNPPQYEGYIE
ncbi:MAG: hypothetical protein IJC10_02965 [Clostridia bacterium]|nr:hypothetical protein [Clostridia bacterium]